MIQGFKTAEKQKDPQRTLVTKVIQEVQWLWEAKGSSQRTVVRKGDPRLPARSTISLKTQHHVPAQAPIASRSTNCRHPPFRTEAAGLSNRRCPPLPLAGSSPLLLPAQATRLSQEPNSTITLPPPAYEEVSALPPKVPVPAPN